MQPLRGSDSKSVERNLAVATTVIHAADCRFDTDTEEFGMDHYGP